MYLTFPADIIDLSLIIQAMANEMTHVQDYQIKLYEYGWSPSPLRWLFWLVGSSLVFSAACGEKNQC
ncbi:hypothetical protein UNSWDHB_2144 [Dehalobacter sp. UNSWDHB]|uniref:hypothetical protein n=1 Tax=unclassified Dehalobacter TaxID=2635733 RepID=UPI00028A93F9|nr:MULTISPECIES: hypothetical protein [unclassified Dehalobacter]AFV03018.1 hypothetical protein DHBDCA_p1991 [Dehalobacter sp. DCA]AFV06006.1 hypothetical protein DCF50_p2003 [Dehalobacter sp. CF]EQB20527.1 hypothetical protein UNSWDHB_2144 [Dehalobacter sp. UNSWDHB]